MIGEYDGWTEISAGWVFIALLSLGGGGHCLVLVRAAFFMHAPLARTRCIYTMHLSCYAGWIFDARCMCSLKIRLEGEALVGPL